MDDPLSELIDATIDGTKVKKMRRSAETLSEEPKLPISDSPPLEAKPNDRTVAVDEVSMCGPLLPE